MAEISRRSLFGALAALAAVPVLAAHAGPKPKRRTFGHLTVENCAAKGIAVSHVRVRLNGRDVIGDGPKVLEADDERGFIVRYARDAHGRMYPGSDGRLGRETIYGDVEIRVLEGGWLV